MELLDEKLLKDGARFVVVAEGGSLRGMTPCGPGVTTTDRVELEVGDVLTCIGHGPGWGSDPGYGYRWRPEGRWAHMSHIQFSPAPFSIWSFGVPYVGYIEPIEED